MAESCAPEAGNKAKDDAAQKERAKILEGVDFIETEEDAEAVESAVVKIQSTFRGKKIRSKLGTTNNQSQGNKQPPSSGQQSSKPSDEQTTTTTSANNSQPQPPRLSKQEEELNKRVADMDVNDNKSNPASAGLPKEEAERAATKIQAGFKGYKTRKELGSGCKPASGGGQPPTDAPSGDHQANK